MKTLRGIAFGVVCGFLGAGLLLLATNRPRGEPIQLSPPPTPAPMVVHVSGAVIKPGVYSLPSGSRVKDAIEKSGGLKIEADSNLINLAMLVEDGMQVWVPYQPVDEENTDTPMDLEGKPTPGGVATNKININTASQIELESLSGIGPVLAQAIIQYRLEKGPFNEIEEIQEVSGIGPVTFEKIKPFISVRGPSGN
jgi:competence protein ComEA